MLDFKKKPEANLGRRVFRDPILFLATGGGLGCFPRGPGTLGALLGLIAAYGMYLHFSFAGNVTMTVAMLFVGIPICGHAAKKLNVEDPSCVIWDEIATMPLVFLGTTPPLGEAPWYWLTGFALHRFFDISKFFPAKQCEEFPGGIGIMADDCVAAGYACLAMHVVQWFWIGGGS